LLMRWSGGHFGPLPTPLPTKAPVPTLAPNVTPILTPAPTAAPALGIGSTWTRPADGMVMVYVPEGEFKMGSPQNTGYDNEHPEHSVYLDAFWIDKTDVTNAMYAMCVKAGDCRMPHNTSSSTRHSYYGDSQYGNYPVIYVDWNQANTYCQWAEARLPTEAEWEKAARGKDGRSFPWGNTDPTCALANYSGCMGNTTAVDAHPSGASPYGALDMAGNVWQLVADRYDPRYYASSPSSNPTGPSSGQIRVLRGGSWYNYQNYVRSAYRNQPDPTQGLIDVGFRCARPAK
jgi:eukaryotic-like serine/threonine-protein kinase